MNELLTRSWDYHKKLTSRMEKSSSHVEILKKFFENIQIANEQYANSLKTISEEFYQGISTELIDNETLLCCYNYICHFVLNLSHHHTTLANDIHNKILEPFQLFSENFRETNKNLLKSGQTIIEDLEASKIDLVKCQEKYYHKAKETEKFFKSNESVFKKLDLQKKGIEDTNYYVYELTSKQNMTNAYCKEYRNLISIVNKQWENFDTEFFSIFDAFGLNEESRVHFTKLNISQIIRTLQESSAEINKGMNDYSMQNFENRMKQIEESLSSKKNSLSDIVDPADFNQSIKMTKREEFVSYETHQKIKLQKKSTTSKSGLQYYKENIDSFLALILSDRHSSQVSDKENTFPPHKGQITSDFSSDNSDVETNVSYFADDSKIKEMFPTSALRKHFIERLILRTKRASEFPLPKDKFDKLSNCAGVLLDSLTKDEMNEPEFLFNILIFTTKFYKQNNWNGNKKYLGSKLKDKGIWREQAFWENITYYLLHRRKLEEYQKASLTQSTASNSADDSDLKSEGKSLMNGIRKKFEVLMETNKNLKVDEDSVKAMIMDEVNTYFARLQLNQVLRSAILVDIARRLKLDKASIDSIKNELEKDKHSELYKKMNSPWEGFEKRVQRKGKRIYALNLALDFLGYDDKLLNLLLVCREWKKGLEKKVYRLRLSEIDEKITIQTRKEVWKSILNLEQIKVNYFKIKEKYNLVEQKVIPVEDIITMDVQRSFHNNPNINTMILYNLLRLYAHYDEKVSYCQGMNYVMGFLYCQFKDEGLAFNFFVAIINKEMKSLFEHDLESLKVAFYQLDQLIGMYLPRLSKVFKREGVDASLFSASWFITIFTNVFQYSNTSYTLMRIWDLFLIEGWKGLFKICIYVLEVYQEKLVTMRFDQLLGLLNNLTSQEFFTNFKYNESLEKSKDFTFFDYQPYEEEKPIRFFTQRIANIKITNELLRDLEAEYHKLNPPKAQKKASE